ncbi:ATPase [Aerococcaceae bacterium zg-B36]|uniref:TrlF family AAA-like ATPase n=1 Tax=Aerococcaceae bacterium zg-252 TaxID=2796928 RepID=UPI001BD8A7C8|nr:ATPase [Aerococcaceae bacterium zg-B36]
MRVNRGSEFRKWDLHLHSPYTTLNNQFDRLDGSDTPDIEKIIEKIKSQDISAIGLTNYFNFSEQDFDFKKRLEQEGIVTFLNLEVRLSNINKDDQLFDYHIIFDPQLQDNIIKNLLGQLKASIGSTDKAFNNLTPSEIEHTANISFEKLIDSLESDKELNGRYLKGFLARGHGSATSDSDPKNQAVYEKICIHSDFIIHSSCDNAATCVSGKDCKHNNNIKDRDYWLNKSKYILPLLQSSDAHSIEKIGERYSWIKADLTFDGLRQIKYEPEYRISLTKEKPVLDKDELVIDRIGYLGEEIYLSENLNTIIGGRSTGKSTLLNSIAKKLGNSIGEGSYYFEDLDNFHVVWRDEKEQDSRKVHYIPQEYMFSLAKDNNELKNLVGDIIQSKGMDSAIRTYEQNCSNLQTEIQLLLHEYKEIQRSRNELVRPEAERQATLNRIQINEDKKRELLKNISVTDNEREAFDKMNEELKIKLSEKASHQSDLEYLDKLSVTDIELNDDSSDEPSELVRDKLDIIVKSLNENIQKEFKDKVEELKSNIVKVIHSIDEKIDIIKNDKLFQKCVKYLESNNEIAKLDVLIESENEVLSKINKFNNMVETFTKRENKIKTDIILKYKQYSVFRTELQDSFNILEEDSLKISINFSLNALHSEFDYINARGHAKHNFIDSIEKNFDAVVDRIFEDDTLTFNGNNDKLSHIEYFFNKNFYSYRFDIEYQNDKFEQMSPGKKAFIVLKLILDFSDSKIPVLIDQPEDSLDNRAIYNELTAYIKKTKLNRQIILVTHNPNIVVAGDCENVIVANQESDVSKNKNGKVFDYVNGALESIVKDEGSRFLLQRYSIKEHVCDILEGGRTAFLKRESKYDLQRHHNF